MLMDINFFLFNIPLPCYLKAQTGGFAGFASATDGHHGLEEIQKFPQTRMYYKCSYMQSATFQLYSYTVCCGLNVYYLNRNISQNLCYNTYLLYTDRWQIKKKKPE